MEKLVDKIDEKLFKFTGKGIIPKHSILLAVKVRCFTALNMVRLKISFKDSETGNKYYLSLKGLELKDVEEEFYRNFKRYQKQY